MCRILVFPHEIRFKMIKVIVVKETHWAIEKAEESFCLKLEKRTVWGNKDMKKVPYVAKTKKKKRTKTKQKQQL